LKWTHRALARAALFRKNDDAVAFANALHGELERLHRRAPVLAIDRNESGPPDRPAENRNLEKADLGHETDRLRDRRENARDIEVAVVIRDDDVALIA